MTVIFSNILDRIVYKKYIKENTNMTAIFLDALDRKVYKKYIKENTK